MKKDLIKRIIGASNEININSRKGNANYIIVNSILLEEINKISILHITTGKLVGLKKKILFL